MSKLTQWVRSAQRGRPETRLADCIANPKPVNVYAAATTPGSPTIYSHAAPVDCRSLRYPTSTGHSVNSRLISSLCTAEQMTCDAFRYWAMRMGENWRLHRKLWEYCFILQALYERDMFREGRRGLGFAVGEEPLPSLMASMGCAVVATDLDQTDSRAEQWAKTAQLAASLEGLNKRRLCDDNLFKQRVSFRPVDMNRIPDDLNGFDFTWSSCSFEHCGSIGLGKRFLREQMKCLKPGGIAIHTTEYNLSSVEQTIDSGTTVIFRKQDVEAMIRDLQAEGHEVEKLQLDIGASAEDSYVDIPPYSSNVHLKLELFDQYVSTSVALIIKKSAEGAARNAA